MMSRLASLRVRLILLVVLALLPALVLTVYTNLEQRRLAVASANKDALSLTRLAADQERDLVENARQFLVTLAHVPDVRDDDPAACDAFLADIFLQYSTYTAINVVDARGDGLCSAPPVTQTINYADRAWYKRVVETHAFAVGDYSIGRVSGKPTIVAANPILDNAGQIDKIVLVGMNLEWINKIAASAQLPPGSTLVVLDSNGVMLARVPDPEHWVGRAVPDADIVRTILRERREGTSEATGVDGIRRLYGFTPLGTGAEQNVFVYAGIPTSVAFAGANDTLSRNLELLAVGALLAIVAAWFFGDLFILQQVNRLVSATARLTTGDLGARTGLAHGPGELGQLARAFDEMAQALQEREQRIVKQNRELGDLTDELKLQLQERERAERELARLVEELKRSNAELEQFAYVASHDLQEPLRMVASYTQLLARRYQSQLDPKADQYIAFAVDGANRMQQLINDLLMFSRVTTRSKPLERTDCNEVVVRSLKNLHVAIEESHAQVTVDSLPVVNADASQLVQVFQNLISNAIKFHGAQPPQVSVHAERKDGEWMFSVKDNGIGIEPQYFERIFVIFQRLHPKNEYPGTGIGLAICKKIVERHGGRIWVESARGKGTTFFFSLPTTAYEVRPAHTEVTDTVRVS